MKPSIINFYDVIHNQLEIVIGSDQIFEIFRQCEL